jgi:UV DNA damage repair endonuclease
MVRSARTTGSRYIMTTNDKNSESIGETVEVARETWTRPEIVSFEPVSATQSATFNPGDGLSSNS